MKTESNPWSKFDSAFRQMDDAWRTFDWSRFEDVRHTKTDNPEDALGRKVHTLEARTWRSRRRMAKLFLWLAWRILTKGRATVRL